MNKKTLNILLVLFLIIIISIFAFVVFSRKIEAPVDTTNNNDSMIAMMSDTIVVSNPTNGQVLDTKSIKLTGKARGSWYFEGSAPVEIRDINNNLLKETYITAQGEWMTTEFVSFEGETNFTLPSGITSGFIIFKNSNASGEPQYDKKLVIPVKFK